MKNVIVTTGIAMLLLATPAAAQQVNRPMATENMQSLQINTRYINQVHVRAVRDFLKRDKTATNIDWMVVESGYVAKYTDTNGSHCRSVYTRRGDFVYTVKQYQESNLPREIRGIVKSQYYDYTITLVEEIQEPHTSLVYVVHLEDATTIKNVRVVDRSIEVLEEYNKMP